MFVSEDIEVHDTLIDPGLRGRLCEAVSWMPMHFLNRWERFKSHELDMHWYYPIAFSEQPYEADVEHELRSLDEGLSPIVECWDRIKGSLGDSTRLYECMLSANTFGTEGRVHQDIALECDRPRHITALVYCNKEWNVSWAGETLFFDPENEISAAVMPKPGRVVIARGDAPHVGRSVSRVCPTDRRVLVFKAWRD